MTGRKRTEPHYRGLRGLPSAKLPAGWFLVHNHVRPQRPLGLAGFRAWLQDDRHGLVKCTCDFGNNNNADLRPHYRVKKLVPRR